MKTEYSTPKLTVYGGIETATQAKGKEPIKDAIIFNGTPLGIPTDGSSDIELP